MNFSVSKKIFVATHFIKLHLTFVSLPAWTLPLVPYASFSEAELLVVIWSLKPAPLLFTH